MRFLANNDLNLLYSFFLTAARLCITASPIHFSARDSFLIWSYSIIQYIRVYVPAGCDLACLVIPVREASLFHRRHRAE